VGKLLERVIAARLETHMRHRESGWHSSQYGFRQGRSTIDAVKHARRSAQEMVTRQGVALAVSLDFTNAFNTIPWDRIIEALRHCRVPKYHLVEVIKTYLSDRWVKFSSQRGIERRLVERGSHKDQCWDLSSGLRHTIECYAAQDHWVRTWYVTRSHRGTLVA
jgi:retron-type reverse transcriptase